MMCGGFTCSKNALAFLNILYLLISFLLIGVAAYAKAVAVIKSFEIAGGVIASGLFLFLVAFLGLIAGSKHHQVLLFFYIVILFLLFIIQFSVSIACLAVSKNQVTAGIESLWGPNNESSHVKDDAQSTFRCCQWTWEESNCSKYAQSYCDVSKQFCSCNTSNTLSNLPHCRPCNQVIPSVVTNKLDITGGIGLFFSFTEMLGVWLAVRYRNQKDPSANPDQFL